MSMNSCTNFGPHPSDMTGKFIVNFSMKEDAVKKDQIKNRISDALNEAKDELTNAKRDLDREFDVNNIDTTTVEGKIEYSAKMFGKSMAQFGLQLGELGKNMGGIFGNLAEQGINLSAAMLNKIEVEVELLEDGDIKTEDSMLNFSTANARWEVKEDEFIISNRDNEPTGIFKIIDRNNQGFVIEKENVQINFKRIEK